MHLDYPSRRPRGRAAAHPYPASRAPWWRRVLSLYRDGFREMEVGRRLWIIVIVKVVVLVTLALTLFPNQLNEAYDTDADKAAHVLDALTPAATEVAP